jgi:hypothetical protein
MLPVFHAVSSARIHASALWRLGAARGRSGVEVAIDGDWAWVRWPARDEKVVHLLLPADGVHFYLSRDGQWYRLGKRLPEFDFPSGLHYRPLDRVLLPARIGPISTAVPRFKPVHLKLVAGNRPRPTTLIESNLIELERWAQAAPAEQVLTLRAARCGERVLLMGDRLPLLAANRRFWGKAVFVPLGYRPDPVSSEDAIREAFAVPADSFMLMDHEAVECVPCAAFEPLTPARIRLALQGAD